MPSYYTYLISSLPGLSFTAKLPLSMATFMSKCENFIPDRELEILRASCGQNNYSWDSQNPRSVKQWVSFEIALRNELAQARAVRKKVDPIQFLHPAGPAQPAVSHIAMAAYRSTSIWDAEKMLDQARWDFLDDLGRGHYFDFDALLVYGLKLKILERWDNIQKADKERLLNTAVLN